MVDTEARQRLKPWFRRLIRGEVWDSEYHRNIGSVYSSKSGKDTAVEEALLYAEVLTCGINSVKFMGDRSLFPELLEYLERLADVLTSNEPYENSAIAQKMEYFAQISRRLYPEEPTTSAVVRSYLQSWRARLLRVFSPDKR